MKTKKFFIMVFLLCLTMASCQKDQDIPTSAPILQSADLNDPSLGDSSHLSLKISSANILNATNANQIPSQLFAVNPIYKTAYAHYKQPDWVSCSWTSYVNCINTIVTAHNNYCYGTPISTIRYRCEHYYPERNVYGASHVLALAWHLSTYDYKQVCFSRSSTNNRWEATKQMLSHINTHHSPFLVRSSINSVGHYLVVFSIDWKQSESSSIVYYTDCCYADNGTFNANIRSMPLATFLDRMVGAGAHYYNVIFMWD